MNKILLRLFTVIFIVLFTLSTNVAKERTAQNSVREKPFFQNYNLLNVRSIPINSVKHNTGKAFMKSLVLPGWGELDAGATTRAKSFLIAEGLLWSGFVTLQIYSHWKQSDLENFAVERAGVNSTGKDKGFYSDMSNFHDIYEYNEEKRRFRQYDEVYPVDTDHFWEWKNEKDFKRFDDLRSSGEIAARNATLVVGGILVNHILSAVDAVWVTHQANKRIAANLRVTPRRSLNGELYLSFNLAASW